jgi:serpin B
MAKTLRFNMPQADVGPAFQSLLATMPGANHDGCKLLTANRLWGQQGYGFTDSFLSSTREQFGADLVTVDFAQPEAVCRRINAWADEKTAGKIRQMVDPGTINARLRFVLTNAVYFKGMWQEQFSKAATKAASFHLSDRHIDVPMMYQMVACRYGTTDKFAILERPYRGRDIAMMILLPEKTPGALSELEQRLSAASVQQWSSQLKLQLVEVYLPRFKLETGLDVMSLLRSMGMTKVFQPDQADLSGINDGRERLWLDRVLHRAFVQVDEDGTEAAAATGAMGGFGGPSRLPVFCADRPFIFLIRDTRTGSILFLGRLTRPEPAPAGMPKARMPDSPLGRGMGMY